MTTPPDLTASLTDVLRCVAEVMLLVHTNPWELDEAALAAGFRHGICEAWDADGLQEELQRRALEGPASGACELPVLPRMIAGGRLGRMAGVGWFRYPGGGGLVIDPLVEDLLREEARFAGITRVELEGAALRRVLMAALMNAAAWLSLRRGCPPEVIDQACEEIGMPQVFARADEIGARALQAQIKELSGTFKPNAPAPLILQTAAAAGRFRTG